jgi:hypothetical protein
MDSKKVHQSRIAGGLTSDGVALLRLIKRHEGTFYEVILFDLCRFTFQQTNFLFLSGVVHLSCDFFNIFDNLLLDSVIVSFLKVQEFHGLVLNLT